MKKLKGKGRHLAVLALGLLLIKALWFSASAVIPQLAGAWQLDGSQRAWLTMSVQLGFVAGALVSAIFNLADRYDLTRLLVASALIATMANAAIPWLHACKRGRWFQNDLSIHSERSNSVAPSLHS